MLTLKDKLRHAFAVKSTCEGADNTLPEVLEQLAQAIVNRQMETPAIIFLEAVIPLNFLGSQIMYALWPLFKMASIPGGATLGEIASHFESRETIRRLIDRIEEMATEGFEN